MNNIEQTTALNGQIDADGYVVSEEEDKVSIPFYLANLLSEMSKEIEWYNDRRNKINGINGMIKGCQKTFPLYKKSY